MTERMVQVPVSLIERARDAFVGTNDHHIGEALNRALLSQSTPSAEAKCDDWNAPTGAPWDSALRPTATPPRIEDMAPGTTFTIDTKFGMTVRAIRAPAPPRPSQNSIVLEIDGWCHMDASHYDPSTIRDVTPPKEPTA